MEEQADGQSSRAVVSNQIDKVPYIRGEVNLY